MRKSEMMAAALLLAVAMPASVFAHPHTLQQCPDGLIPLGFVQEVRLPAHGMKEWHIQRPVQLSLERVRIQSSDGEPLLGTLVMEDDYYGTRTFQLSGGTTYEQRLGHIHFTDNFRLRLMPHRAIDARIAVNTYGRRPLQNGVPSVITDLLAAEFHLRPGGAPVTITTRGGSGNVVLEVVTAHDEGKGQQVCERGGGGTVHRCDLPAGRGYSLDLYGDVEGVEVLATW